MDLFENLKENNKQIQEEYSKEISKLEEWSFTKYEQMIFDSSIHCWNENSSEFDSIIFNKEKLMFFIEDTNDNLFGCYINSKINRCKYKKGSGIRDENAFIFSIKNNGKSDEMIKMDIKKELSDSAFTLYTKESDKLFEIGRGCDICIKKENNKKLCFNIPQTFKYPEGKENILTGFKNPFEVKRIIVIQMK